MPLRDKKKDEKHYTEAIQERQERIGKLKEILKTADHDNVPGLWENLQALHFEIADAMYSRGDDLLLIKPFVEDGLKLQSTKMYEYRQRRISLQDVLKKETTDDYPEFKKAYSNSAIFEQYHHILQLVSRAILFNVEAVIIHQYAKDAIAPGVDFLLDYILHSQVEEWPVKGKLNYAKKVEELYKAATDPKTKDENLTAYASLWLTKMKGHPLFGPHMLKYNNYVGYWCFEAAAIAKLTGADLKKLATLKHYPTEHL